MTSDQLIARYIASTAIAISGSNGHGRTFSVARTLYNGFSLSEQDTLRWLTEFSKRCQPPWSEKELIHKVRCAAAASYDKPRGYMLSSPQEASQNGNGKLHYEVVRKPVAADFIQATENYLGDFRCTESDLYDASPVKPSDKLSADGPLILEHLFSQGEEVNFVLNFELAKRADGKVKANPKDSGVINDRDLIIKVWKEDGTPSSDAGGWLRINPVHAGVADANVTSFRHMLVEFDNLPISLQLSFFARFPAPISVLMTSGGSSVHAWLKINASSRSEFDVAFSKVQSQLARLGMDRKNKNPARLSRLPGATRKADAGPDGRQRILYLNPEPQPNTIIL